jgi:hypothetical protein
MKLNKIFDQEPPLVKELSAGIYLKKNFFILNIYYIFAMLVLYENTKNIPHLHCQKLHQRQEDEPLYLRIFLLWVNTE